MPQATTRRRSRLQPAYDRLGASFPAELVMTADPDRLHQLRPEAGEALAAEVPDAAIDDAVRSRFEERLSEALGRGVVVGIVNRRSAADRADVMESRRHVGEIHPQLHARLEAADFGDFAAAMEHRLHEGGFERPPRVPRAAIVA